jgi:hypothetical protein
MASFLNDNNSSGHSWFDPSLMAVGAAIAVAGTIVVKLIAGVLGGKKK